MDLYNSVSIVIRNRRGERGERDVRGEREGGARGRYT